MGLRVSGASDDLIQIKGDITEEFNHYAGDNDEGVYLAFSDGTVLKAFRDSDGLWRLSVLCRSGSTNGWICNSKSLCTFC